MKSSNSESRSKSGARGLTNPESHRFADGVLFTTRVEENMTESARQARPGVPTRKVISPILRLACWTFIATTILLSVGCTNAESARSDAKIAPSPQAAGAQELDFGPQQKIDFSAIRSSATAAISLNSEQDFRLRLKSGGIVVVSESDLVTGEPNFQKRGLQFMALDTLELKKGARIVTGGNDLVIFANKIISEDGSIVAFTEKTQKAADANSPGGAGQPGVSAGTVTLFAINGIDGRVHVDLSGQDGGNGTKGSIGAVGAPGVRGVNANSAGIYCASGGQNGTDGGNGSKGATGGPSGNGGHGGSFFLYNVGDQPIPNADYDFSAKPGNAGLAASGGDGGNGGPGGQGGSGDGPCSGGHAGQPGHQGPAGEPGPLGQSGSPGNILVKNMDMELVIKTAKQIPLNQGR